MNLTHEYMHHRTGYRLGAGCCWIRIYKGAEGDAPVVVCEQLPRVGDAATEEVSGFLAAEVIREHFADGLPDLPRPLLWIEHRPARRRGPGKYFLHTFPSYRPRTVGAGFVRRHPRDLASRAPVPVGGRHPDKSGLGRPRPPVRLCGEILVHTLGHFCP
jgi:hypothetical protein